ncbi:hypothetical protein L9F63_021649 [Diploptera punctata]|uniref:Pre-C2HC domain-containing protein n=1 Tax=Diploptera punctata TaxID=6984 RepID=A0AAD8EBJ2_DIPPU|nr:hypothetical protein L9F63_021649 [Diploptera punctata]
MGKPKKKRTSQNVALTPPIAQRTRQKSQAEKKQPSSPKPAASTASKAELSMTVDRPPEDSPSNDGGATGGSGTQDSRVDRPPGDSPSNDGGATGGSGTQDSSQSQSKPSPLLIRREFTVELAAANRVFAEIEPRAFICEPTPLGTRVRLTSMSAYYKYRQLLLQRQIPCCEGNKKSRATARKFVVKGIDSGVDPTEIQDDLKGHGLEVFQVVNMISGRTKRPLPIFIAVLAEGSNAADILQINRLCHYKVKVEAYRRAKVPKPAARPKIVVQAIPAADKQAVPVELAPAALLNSSGSEVPIALRPESPRRKKIVAQATPAADKQTVPVELAPAAFPNSTGSKVPRALRPDPPRSKDLFTKPAVFTDAVYDGKIQCQHGHRHQRPHKQKT